MKISTIAGPELGPELTETWIALQRANASLASAYFHPEFTRLAASVKPNVEIAIMEDAGKIVGIFPFERVAKSLGEPVGSFLSDYQGVVSADELDFDPSQLLHACKLIAWNFSSVPMTQTCFKSGVQSLTTSAQMSLADGYAAYAERKRAAGSDLFSRLAYKERLLARDVGPVRFAIHEFDRAVLDQVLDWKSEQYLRTGNPDILALPWVRALCTELHETQTKDFAGVLSALYAGDHLIAGHFGPRSQSSWQHFFPSYDTTFAKYSPGLILILKMAEGASGLGVRMIDFGTGQHSYKERFATGTTALSRGSLELLSWRSVRRSVKRGIRALRSFARRGHDA